MEIKLQCNIPSLKHKFGDVVELADDALTQRLLKKGLAITMNEAEVIEQAESEVEAEEKAKAEAKAVADAKVEKAKSAQSVAAKKSKNYGVMTKAQLVAEAAKLEVDVDAKANKPDIIAAIHASLDI